MCNWLRGVMLMVFVMSSVCARAQEDNIRLWIKVVDSFTRKPLSNVRVDVFETDSTTVLKERLAYYHHKPSAYNPMGLCYYGNVPRRTAYVVRFTCKNYEDQYLRIDIPSRRLGKKTKEWVHKKDVLLRKKSSAFDRELGEAKVTASRIAMVVKGDTVEYDARAFRLAEGSMLDNLMAMLPGVTLTAKGEIYYNGQYVERLMVNGRNFFNGNPKIALDNLPAYTVDKLRFYHEGPKWEHLVDDKNQYHGKRPLVADVRLKREYAQGWIANFEVGGGSKTSGGWNEIYLARVFGMRYTDHSGIGVFGNINNLSDDQSPGRKGEWKRMDVTQGERTVKKAGVNFNVDGKRTKVNYETTLEAKHEDAVNVTNQASVTSQGSVRQRIESTNVGNSGQTYVKWDNTLDIPVKNAYFSFMPKLEYTHSNEDYRYEVDEKTAAAALNDANAVWTDGYSRYQSVLTRGDKWNLFATASSVFRSPLSGKNVELGAPLIMSTTTPVRRTSTDSPMREKMAKAWGSKRDGATICLKRDTGTT